MDFKYGVKKGLPIAIGYFPVSFTFGLMAVRDGLPVSLAVLFSFSNVTSAGQFAGEKIIVAGGAYIEMVLTTFIINLRYMLMSLSLSQKLDDGFNLPKRMITAFGITDEIFTVASLESKKVTFPYMCGLICTPVLGWTLGTFFGAIISNALPALLSSAMGIALYGMFMAIIIPPARKSSKVLTVILMAVLFTCIMKYVPFLGFISSGFRVIIATILAAGIGAFIFPVEDKE